MSAGFCRNNGCKSSLLFVVLGLAGPRLDGSNNIIPHSILGDVEDFVSEAVRRGDLAVVRISLQQTRYM